jgi:transcriptional accessory protein Tex/SPT6
VKVLDVDLERKRIALTMRFEKKPATPVARSQAPRMPREAAAGASKPGGGRRKPTQAQPPPVRPTTGETAMSAAFSRLLKRS